MKTIRIAFAALSLAGFGSVAVAVAVAAPPAKLKGAHLAGQARVKLTTARITALRARPGTITDQELEKEKGGSGLRYSFDITSHGKAYEVGVDAKNGTILEDAVEGKTRD